MALHTVLVDKVQKLLSNLQTVLLLYKNLSMDPFVSRVVEFVQRRENLLSLHLFHQLYRRLSFKIRKNAVLLKIVFKINYLPLFF